MRGRYSKALPLPTQRCQPMGRKLSAEQNTISPPLGRRVELMATFLQPIYLAGHGGWKMPRKLRRCIAKSEMHRAWFLGYSGFFEQDGIRYGFARPYHERLR